VTTENVSAKGGAPTSVTAHDEPVTSLCWSPDGLFLYSSGKDNKIHMWNADTGRNTLVHSSCACVVMNVCRARAALTRAVWEGL
jgi:WD40 repeat protein